MKKLILVAVGLFIFLPFLQVEAQTTSTPNASNIVKLINSERTSRGLSPLSENTLLTKAAKTRSGVLASMGKLIHVSAPSGSAWPTLAAVGYSYTLAGENLASIPPATMEVVPAWMESAPHRANILTSEYKEVGIGISQGPYQGGTAYYVVAYFADPKDQVIETQISSENQLISKINSGNLKLRAAITREDKVSAIINLIGLLKQYLIILEANE